jgi:hypothetical protein
MAEFPGDFPAAKEIENSFPTRKGDMALEKEDTD